MSKHKYRTYIAKERTPKSRGYHILHGVLAVLVANHTGKITEDIGWAIGDAIYEYLAGRGKTVEDIQKNPSEFAKLVVRKLQEQEVIGPTVARSTQRAIKEIIPAAMKLIDKMWPKDHSVKHLKAMREAFSSNTKNPIRTLKASGIDITKEVEELRNKIAEVTGKKPKSAKKPKSRRKATPKSKQVQKEVESKKEVPGEKVITKLTAWLDRWFENAVESYTYRKLGGVPMGELKNFRNILLVRKHVAEVAMEVMGEHWVKGNLVKIKEHVNKLSLVEKHAGEMFEELENIRKAVKEGKMSVGEAITLVSLERNLLDMVQERVERLMGSPEYLAKNPRPLGPEDEYVVKLPAIAEIHKKLLELR